MGDETNAADSPEHQSPDNTAMKREKTRINKLYRTPPTPEPEVLREKEQGFVIDGNAVSSISIDYSKTNPKLGAVIPPYNSQNDEHVLNYFQFIGVTGILERTGQHGQGSSIDGPVLDKFYTSGHGYQYLHNRNEKGAGHSREVVDGHSQFMQGVEPVTGYNGKYGYRRNTPWLRQRPSPFGTGSRSATH